MIRKLCYFVLISAILFTSCTGVSVPSEYEKVDAAAQIFPEYTDVTIPSNIAPLNFMVRNAEKVVAMFCWKDCSEVFGKGNIIQIPENKWKQIISQAKGDSICVSLFSLSEGKWTRWNDFRIYVAPEPLDKYLSYRLIEPSYISYEIMEIKQRDIENFEERTFYDTRGSRREGKDQCINCHSYQNFSTDNMLFHIRGNNGGTVMFKDGKQELLTDLKQEWMISNPVYPAWHPVDDVIAFSTNTTRQIFHTHDNAKVEVQDFESHLVLFDVKNRRMIPVDSDTLDMETFPAWSPDGTKLYYCSARYEAQNSTVSFTRDMMTNYKDVHYSLYVRDYDRNTMTLGPRRTVLEAPDESATLPRVSPDGRYLLFAHGAYGCFHIWHQDADIHMLDLENGTVDELPFVNSRRAESYPSWSSNGRWIVMASRRDDGNYSRVYIAYFNEEGKACKAFELPQKDPASNDRLLKSYNRPELTVNSLPEIL